MSGRRVRGALLVLGACLFASGVTAEDTAPFWTKRHRPLQYAAFHSLALTVKDLSRAREQVDKALTAAGGVSTVGKENQVGSDTVGYAQWSYGVPTGAADALLKRLRTLGTVTRDVRTENIQPDETAEVRLKRDRLAAERASAKPLLDRFPATAAAAQEILAHLEAVLADSETGKSRVLVNVAVDGPPVPETK